jgi:hypothetical protein
MFSNFIEILKSKALFAIFKKNRLSTPAPTKYDMY